MLLEIIAFNIQSCATIQNAGAQRIELCGNPTEGGTTPSYGFIKAAREVTGIQLFPIIRPRGGDFLYSNEEFEIMKSEIKLCKEFGCDGVVIGLLNADGTIDKKRTAALVSLAYPLEVTFHRAFDRVKDMYIALEDVIEAGCGRILTSGLFPTAEQGMGNLQKLVEAANNRIVIMPGSGVRSDNINIIAQKTGASEFHSSARILSASLMQHYNKNMNETLEYNTVDEDEVKKLVTAIK
ncbi:MAG: copper homeostasis protein CutC [Chitinophagaceae bacterium]|jgi:copper homeostasis protein|nr:copper homeostasis protein CutC [Chitinophagaceae bacterium]MBP6045733.1 copper homeostasis protein CutC [Ferruginibacter sp.]MBK7346820.1 copper homeostasis protein CutC [Chitinophagaceae bacterium]MBK8773333.1 copper homeostasis protein CutC [Chitinophagaceae bacterium]MBK9958144.1 copper homeostasis protein CutC [Chitinophagaceae bacterium]